MRSLLISFFLFSTSLQFCLAEDDSSYTANPKYVIEQVVVMAKDYAITRGRDLDKYFVNRVSYDLTEKEWTVFFQGTVLIPGHHFSVLIKEKTGEVVLYAGQ